MEQAGESAHLAAASVRLTAQEHAEMAREATRLGLASVSDYLHHLHRERVAPASEAALCADGNGQQEALADAHPASGIRPYHQTALGTVLLGDALCHLHNAPPESVDLVMTSPPFGKKATYTIAAPCSVPADGAETPLAEDGGAERPSGPAAAPSIPERNGTGGRERRHSLATGEPIAVAGATA